MPFLHFLVREYLARRSPNHPTNRMLLLEWSKNPSCVPVTSPAMPTVHPVSCHHTLLATRRCRRRIHCDFRFVAHYFRSSRPTGSSSAHGAWIRKHRGCPAPGQCRLPRATSGDPRRSGDVGPSRLSSRWAFRVGNWTSADRHSVHSGHSIDPVLL